MRRIRNRRRMGWVATGLIAATTTVAILGWSVLKGEPSWLDSKEPVTYVTAEARRIVLDAAVSTGGEVESAEKTVIECDLDAAIGSDWGSAAILTLSPEGSTVKKGDVICTLDASRYDEKLRLAEILLGESHAAFEKARLSLEVAKLAVDEYRDGTMTMTRKTLKGQVAEAQSNHEQGVGRLKWSEGMFKKGYLSKAQIVSEEAGVARFAHALKLAKTALNVFEKFNAPKYLHVLEATVHQSQATFEYEKSRLALYEDQTLYFREQVAACTIKAPHDGFLVYYEYPFAPELRAKQGNVVLKTQKLFYLPDLTKMQVSATLHESVVDLVRPGMKVDVKIEGLPGRTFAGHVGPITLMPASDWWSGVKTFTATINLDGFNEGLMPGMTASVEILHEKREVLAIPNEALAVEDGRQVCFVSGPNGLVRREIAVGRSTPDMIEIVEGLEEGETVVLNHGKNAPDLLIPAVKDSKPAAEAVADSSSGAHSQG